MKKYFLIFSIFISVAGLSSCKKENTTAAAAAVQAAYDDAAIQTYMQANNITATKDPTGYYYQITTQGTGPYPTSTSNVSIAYTGKYLNGLVTFETSPSEYVPLPGAILAWQLGIPRINDGGSILLLVPSALGYGPAGTTSVPANAVLIFNITLQGFN